MADANDDIVDEHPEVLTNSNYPSFVTTIVYQGIGYIQSYGWIILGAVILGVYLWRKFQAKMISRSKDQAHLVYKKHDANGTSSEQLRHLEAMERSRARMQSDLDSKAQIFAEKQQQKDEEKRQQRIDDWDRHLEGKGYRSKYKTTQEEEEPGFLKKNTPKKPLRPNTYNPLTGSGSSSSGSYRPPQRGGASGGG